MISENFKNVLKRIDEAASRAGKRGHDITLVCVTKTATVAQIEEAIDSGAKVMGESYVHDAAAKFKAIGDRVKWHLIGHLQTNKVKDAVRIFDLIHSVDSFKLAEEISRRCAALRVAKEILIEIKTSEEAEKFGILPEHAISLLEKISGLPNIKVAGLMTMAPVVPDPQLARPYFARIKKIAMIISDKRFRNVEMRYLSMGMSQDFEVAIEEGANIVRVGRAIFEG